MRSTFASWSLLQWSLLNSRLDLDSRLRLNGKKALSAVQSDSRPAMLSCSTTCSALNEALYACWCYDRGAVC